MKDCNVLIIGTDNHNTLAVIRNLGSHGYNVKVLIHSNVGNIKKIKVSKTKFSQGNTFIVDDTKEAIYKFLKNYDTEGKSVVLFPCSDLAAYSIDNYANELNKFILPGFNNQPGLVIQLMDKYKQKEFATYYGIPMADTWKINLKSELDLERIPFPCILKPEISAMGRKGDIRICISAADLNSAIQMLKEKGYNEVILQRFLKKKYEVCAFGCIINQFSERYIYGQMKKTREWPVNGGGNMTAGVFIKNEEVDSILRAILDILRDKGYLGQFDIEFLVCEEGVFLNEMNFRHSGNGFGLIDNGVLCPFYYCEDRLNHSLPDTCKFEPDVGYTMIEEMSDLKYYKEHGLKFFEWLLIFFRTNSYSVINRNDLHGTIAFLTERFTNLVKKIQKG